MSGDVQPRRRKDKRRKKDEDDVGTPPPTLVSPSADPLAENLTIHVQKDSGTGGHWCARVVFFALFAILVGLVGIILLEHRGAADVDTPLAESRWALVFEGWVDDVKPSYDNGKSVSQHDDHLEHMDEEEATEVDSQEAGQRDEGVDSEVEDEDEYEYNKMQEALLKEIESNETDGEERSGLDSHQEPSDSQEEIASHEIDHEDLSDEKEGSEESVPHGVAWNAEDDDDAENAVLEEIEEGTSQEEIEATEREKDDSIAGSDENDASIEGVDTLTYRQNDDHPRDYEDFVGISGISEINDIDDNSAEPLEEFEDEEPEEIRDEAIVEPDVEELQEESSSVAAKFGVGIALVIAAHFVLVRRWNNGANAPLVAQSEFVGKPQMMGESTSGRKNAQLEQSGTRANVIENIPDPDSDFYREKLDTAHGQTTEERVIYFTAKLSDHPASPWMRYELAKALDDLAEEKKDNSYLRKAIAAYQSVGELGTLVPPSLFRIAGERCIDRFRFAGQHSGAEAVHKDLISRFPDEPHLRNQLAITYMMQNKLSEARKVLQQILARWPNDGLALAHYGFILKTGDGNMVDAIMYLKAGIDSGHEGTIDGRFFFHLGDALVRLGKTEEAKKLYQNGAKRGLFRSVYQRSLYNVDRLTARPWWTLEQTNYKEFFENLEENWRVIKAEGLAVLDQNGQFKNEAENLRDKGNWQQFELFVKGRKILENCAQTPRTCSLVEDFSPAASCRRGQIKFSVMHPNTHVWPHCGPTNCRLRAHLGLTGTARTFIRVADDIRTWRQGSVMVFDDSFEHEVWHNGTLIRLVLIVDVWHPELRENERRTLPAI